MALPWEKRQTYPALYAPGFFAVSVEEIDSAFVSKLDTPARRRMASRLRTFVMYLKKLGVQGDVWVNGSFSTMNPTPSDFDILLVIPRVTLAGMTLENQAELFELTDRGNREYVRKKWSCDLYVCERSNLSMQRQFEIKFSKNPEEGSKGIPVITL